MAFQREHSAWDFFKLLVREHSLPPHQDPSTHISLKCKTSLNQDYPLFPVYLSSILEFGELKDSNPFQRTSDSTGQ